MPRGRWLVVGFLLIAAAVGGWLNERGPFDAHPSLAYEQFLADFQADRVDQIVQWRDQLEVTVQGELRSVVVPSERDLPFDLAQARSAGGVGISYSAIPDSWVMSTTPWVPLLLALASVVILVSAIARTLSRSGRTGGLLPA